MVEEVLDPRVVSIGIIRGAVSPAWIILEDGRPVAFEVEGRVGDDEVRAQVRVLVFGESFSVPWAKVCFDEPVNFSVYGG